MADGRRGGGVRGHRTAAAPPAVGAPGARAGVGRHRVARASMTLALLLDLARQFALLSFLAIGGVNTLIPEIHLRAVEVEHWMTDLEFSQAFAIAQAAPGPNMLI